MKATLSIGLLMFRSMGRVFLWGYCLGPPYVRSAQAKENRIILVWGLVLLIARPFGFGAGRGPRTVLFFARRSGSKCGSGLHRAMEKSGVKSRFVPPHKS
jgi:hypothetical protein